MFEDLQYIDVKDIDLNNLKYRISTDNNLNFLVESIENNGIVTPVILKKENNKFIIVSGYKRIIAGNEIKIDRIPARIINGNNNNEKIEFLCSKLAITENAFQRELNDIEAMHGLSLLKEFLTTEEISLTAPCLFNRPLNYKFITNLFKISCFDDSVHKLILSKKLSINSALKINKYDSDIFNTFINIFNKVRMGQNKQNEIIINLQEIAFRDDIPLIDLLKSKPITDIINHENNDENFKGNLLRLHLKKIRYPQLTKAHDDYKKCIRELKIEPEIKIEPPLNFEGEKYSLSFQFTDLNEFDKKVLKLNSLKQNLNFQSTFK